MSWRDRIKEFRRVPVGELKANPKNWREHPPEQRKALEGVLAEIGIAGALLARETDAGLELVDGHLRSEMDDATEWPVLVLDVDEGEADVLLASVDPIAAMAKRNDDALAALLAGIETDNANLDAMLTDLEKTLPTQITEGETDADAVPEGDQVEKRCEPGDLWTLGRHRLLCGDSTSQDEISRLIDGGTVDMVFTDPPYALFGNSTGVQGIADDKMVRPFFRDVLAQCKRSVKPCGHVYICCDWHSATTIDLIAKESTLIPKNLIVWDKGDGGVGAMYQHCYELVWFFSNTPEQTGTLRKTANERTVHGLPNIWRFSRVPSAQRKHNAAKPVEMIEVPLLASCDSGESVLDLFAGSGSTLISCEKQNRVFFGAEIEPKFCDVILARWESFTGQKASRA